MGQKRTLLNKLRSSTRQRSKKPGTPFRRCITATVEGTTHNLMYTYHTTKGRVRWIVVAKSAVEAPATIADTDPGIAGAKLVDDILAHDPRWELDTTAAGLGSDSAVGMGAGQ